ncbi:alpha/beta hydrolase [Sorangium cellulosum]|uniref:Alpha/beta hydrolase n=1 Tax=Sorangium cellulosum TaxID=56 RepID=A0A2L0EMQ8_SORCE|nr:alpha/beta hydrolase [Sorangium cellulosum]AUX40587.1 alpha/beta hydrolase [Sorangium cellulosum]
MIQHHHADLGQIRMHYVTAGEGEPVLFLHGFPEYWGVWRSVIEDLSRDHRTIAPDLRGYNLTSRPEEVDAYGIEHLVGDVKGLLDHLGVRKVRLVAQDWGGLVAWCFLLRHPEYVERFATINITHPHLFNEALRSDPEQQQASQYMLQFRAPGTEVAMAHDDFASLRAVVFEDARAHGAKLPDDQVEEWLAAWRQPGAIAAGLNYYRAAEIGPPPPGKVVERPSNVLERLGIGPDRYGVEVPVLVLWGEGDRYLLQNGLDRLHRYVRDLHIRKIPGVTHWVTLQRPEVVARSLRGFFRG